MRTEPPARSAILIPLGVLVGPDPASPRPLDSTPTALDRLAWVGRPVVLAGQELLGRGLPLDAADRVAWVRSMLGDDGLAVDAFDEPAADRVGEAAERQAVEQWVVARDTWDAAWLLTARATSVRPARRAELSVVHIGPRDADPGAGIERPDHEARDLLDAVSQLLVHDTFADLQSG